MNIKRKFKWLPGSNEILGLFRISKPKYTVRNVYSQINKDIFVLKLETLNLRMIYKRNTLFFLETVLESKCLTFCHLQHNKTACRLNNWFCFLHNGMKFPRLCINTCMFTHTCRNDNKFLHMYKHSNTHSHQQSIHKQIINIVFLLECHRKFFHSLHN